MCISLNHGPFTLQNSIINHQILSHFQKVSLYWLLFFYYPFFSLFCFYHYVYFIALLSLFDQRFHFQWILNFCYNYVSVYCNTFTQLKILSFSQWKWLINNVHLPDSLGNIMTGYFYCCTLNFWVENQFFFNSWSIWIPSLSLHK